MSASAYIGCNRLLLWNDVVDLETNDPINDAVITFTITGVFQSPGTTITGSLTYVTGSEGNYQAVISGNLTQYFIAGNVYTCVYSLTATGGYIDNRTEIWTGAVRGQV
jgi:hypothetical protein